MQLTNKKRFSKTFSKNSFRVLTCIHKQQGPFIMYTIVISPEMGLDGHVPSYISKLIRKANKTTTTTGLTQPLQDILSS